MSRFVLSRRIILPLLLLGAVSLVFAQRRGRRGTTNQEYRQRENFPTWQNTKGFEHDTFTFARVQYDSWGGGWSRGSRAWKTDHPDSDLNFSLRLQQLTTIKVNPDPVIVRLSDKKLGDYPFLYMIEPGGIELSQAEVDGLKRYCENGGFMMVDDFWGNQEYAQFHQQVMRAFPNRKVEELELSHEIFHNVYNLTEKPQIPSMRWIYDRSYTWERDKGPSARNVHYRAIKDDAGRIMVLICHNTDLGDGWEREGVDRDYFETFSVKRAYPMGINIVTYAMTH